MSRHERLEWAKTRARELRKLYSHVIVCILLILMLVGTDYSHRGSELIYWFTLAWGAAIIVQVSYTWGESWEERRIRKLLREEGVEDA